MAAIDKTYVNRKELIEAIDWCRTVNVCTLDNGYKFIPLNFIYAYNDLDENYNPVNDQEEYILWNTPQWFDRWLWLNCPLDFVRERLKYQYDEDALKEFANYVYKDPNDNIQLGRQHYTFLKKPNFKWWKWYANNARRLNPYPGNCKQTTIEMVITLPGDKFDLTNELQYNHVVNRWYSDYGFMPVDRKDYIWQMYHKRIPTKKSIIRQLRKWYFPSGTIVNVRSIRLKIAWEILVK